MAEIRRLGKSFAGFHGFRKIQDTKSGTVNYTVKVVATPGGNRYQINDKVALMPYFFSGYTYTLDLSDNSNDGHPLLFSETKDGTHTLGGSIYPTNVTYELDSVLVDQPTYVSSFNSATTRKVHIGIDENTPGALYYYCWNHMGMAGESYIVMQISDSDLLAYTTVNLEDKGLDPVILTNGNVLDDPPNTDDRGDPRNAYPYRNLRDQQDGMTYEQWQIVQESILYYLDDNGFLRAVYNENHEYGDPA